jgi:N-acylneuraminate cytidylyltransferase
MFSSEEFQNAGYDSLNTAHFVKDFLWLDGAAMNYNPDRQPRSQDLPDVLALNFAVNIISTRHMRDIKAVVGRKPYLLPISEIESIDIDTELDFEFARFVYDMNNRR